MKGISKFVQEVQGEKMVREHIQKKIEKHGFENPIQIAAPHWLIEEKNMKTTYLLNQIDESKKAIQVEDEYGNKYWLPKSQIEITEF